MDKVKVLFVVDDFYQAGAQRFCYEIDQALDKSKFQIEILCLEKQYVLNKNWKVRYYESLHEKIGTQITYIDKFLENQSLSLPIRVFNKITRNKFKRIKPVYKTDFHLFFDKFDVVHWIGEYTFIHSLPLNIKTKSFIHTMSAKFQNIHLYDAFDFNYAYNFISGFRKEDKEFSDFKHINHTYFPLAMNIFVKENKWNFQDNEIKKIGIFTRLDRYKPLDPFFYAFHLLLDELPNCELHIFGNGDPKKEGMIRYLEHLGITDKVFFRGHQDDIVKTANEEHLDASWFQGYNNDRPLGYAGLDICTTGTPLICWDFHVKPFNSFSPIYPHFKNINSFVNFSLEILRNKEKAESLSIAQFTDVIKANNINNYISDLENSYQSILKNI